jgi:TetR/AcrR family transcriptional repressor of nem operon
LYKEFGDKEGLFLEALEYYRGHVIGPRYQILVDNPSMAGVETFLKNVMTGAAKTEYRGCLMMNHLAQKNVISSDAAILVGAFCAEIKLLIKNALCNAQLDGDIDPGKDPVQFASFVVFCVHGAVLYGRHDSKKPLIPEFYDMIMHALRG